jgi:small GTP-binding protein
MLEKSFKVVFIGADAVGKTTILSNYLSGKYQKEYLPIIKTSICAKVYNFSDFSIKLFLWDPDSDSVFSNQAREFFAETQGVLIVYDICSTSSIERAEHYHEIMLKHVDSDPVLWLVGNKIDLKDRRRVDSALAERKAKKLGAHHIEVSAKTGENVETLFQLLLKNMIMARIMGIRKQLGGRPKNGGNVEPLHEDRGTAAA